MSVGRNGIRVPVPWWSVDAVPGEVTTRFEELMARPEADLALDEAALLIAAHAYPGLDVSFELARIDDIAAVAGSTLDSLVETLFGDFGFRGDRLDYYNPRNSYLNDVVSRRTGIPITLSVLTMAIASRIGVPLAGVGMPGHFLVRDKVDPSVFIDPFGGGALLDEAGCRSRFHAVHGDGVPFDPRFLEPVSGHSIVARMLANLRSVFAAVGDRSSLIWVLRLRTLVPGVPLEERADLAAALASVGQFAEGAREFETLARQVEGELGFQYRASAARLRARLN